MACVKVVVRNVSRRWKWMRHTWCLDAIMIGSSPPKRSLQQHKCQTQSQKASPKRLRIHMTITPNNTVDDPSITFRLRHCSYSYMDNQWRESGRELKQLCLAHSFL